MLLLALFMLLPVPSHASLEIVSCEAFRYVDAADPDTLCLEVRGKVRNAGKTTIPKDAKLAAMVSFMGNCDEASGGGTPNALQKPLPPGETASVQGGGCFNGRAEREKLAQIAYICTDPGGEAKCFNLQGKNCTFDRTKIVNPGNFRECTIRKGKPKH